MLAAELREAKRDPAALQTWRALRLNLGVSEVEDGERLLPAEIWAEAIAGTLPEPAGDCIWGVDLGGSRSLSSVVAYWHKTGLVECLTATGGEPGVEDRGRIDGVGSLYAEAVSEGSLLLGEGRVPEVGDLLREALRRWGQPRLVVADRWRQAELADTLRAVGWGPPVEWRGAGVRDGGTDVALFRREALEGRLRVAPNRLLDHAVAVARCRIAVSGDRVLAPGNRRGARDDPAAAMILAVSGGGGGRGGTPCPYFARSGRFQR